MSVHLALMIESITSTYLAEDNCLKEEEEKKRTKKVNNGFFLYIRSFTQYRFSTSNSNSNSNSNNNNNDNRCNGQKKEKSYFRYVCTKK